MCRIVSYISVLICAMVLYGPIASGQSEPRIRMVLPGKPIVEQEPFQVQFIYEASPEIKDFQPPDFSDFRVVSGPNLYTGSVHNTNGTLTPYRNITFTLLPLKTGTFLMGRARLLTSRGVVETVPAYLQVISRQDAMRMRQAEKAGNVRRSAYYLAPGEDPYDKIRENLILKVMVDRENVYVGEPIVATFKLYSRLESKSDVVKNPGFYGFSVYDMISLQDGQQTVEMINGKTFDVHTIRKAQLYASQPGNYTIDPMEILNQVEFSRSVVNKKTEQEIVEGIFGLKESGEKIGTERYEMMLKTSPVHIRVKPLPPSRNDDSSNIVGDFSISMEALKDTVDRQEQAFINIRVKGQGNLKQVAAPPIRWPRGLEPFDPVVTDSLDKYHVPLAGERKYRFGFVSSTPGTYEIPGVSFTYYNKNKRKWVTDTTDPVFVTVRYEVKEVDAPTDAPKEISPLNGMHPAWWIGFACLLIGIAWLAFRQIYSRRQPGPAVEADSLSYRQPVDVAAIMQPVYRMERETESLFYSALNQAIWKFLVLRFDLAASVINKRRLVVILTEKGIDSRLVMKMVKILEWSETGKYTASSLGINRSEVLAETRELLDALDRSDAV